MARPVRVLIIGATGVFSQPKLPDIAGVDTPDGQEAQEHMAFTMEPVGLSMRLCERSRER